MKEILTYEKFHPFVRCVGTVTHLCQKTRHCAFDYRIIVINDGNGKLEINNDILSTKKGELYLIPPAMPYRVLSEKNQNITVINFDMTYSHCDVSVQVISVPEYNFEKDRVIEEFDLSLFFVKNGYIKKVLSGESINICTDILNTYINKNTELENVYISSLLSQLIYLIVQDNLKKNINPQATSVYRYITDNYSLPLTLESVAEEFHFHPTYVNRLLKKNYGISVRQQLLKCRFDRALYLIDNTDMSIKEIATTVGFNDAQYFSNAFFKRFGYYPSVYRK